MTSHLSQGAPVANGRRQAWLIAGGVFAIALLLRLLWITVPINIDERAWIVRGPSFVLALLDGTPEGTYLRHHPGVTNMWIIGAGLSLRYTLRALLPSDPLIQQSASLYDYLTAVAAAPVVPLSAYTAARAASAFVTAASLAAIYLLSRRVFGAAIALTAAIILLFEPFFLAYQRSITTDANQANFTWISLLAFLLYARAAAGAHSRIAWLILSGVFFGLALLSKATVALTLPVFGVIALWAARQTDNPRSWLRAALDLLLWGGIAALTTLLIWPALRADLRGTLILWHSGLTGEVSGHDQFWFGRYTRDPGILYYPVILLARLSPLLLLGSVAGLAALAIPGVRRHFDHRRAMLAVVLAVGVMLTGVSLFGSKIDRYIVPVMPGLALLTAGGLWAWVGVWQAQRGQSAPSGRALPAMVGAVAVAQLVFLIPHAPYYLSYFSPLIGGPAGAQKRIMVGNGELLDQAAHWLEQNVPSGAIVGMPSYNNSMASYYHEHIWGVMEDRPDRCLPTKCEYVVFYVNFLQRRLLPELAAYFEPQQPLHVVRWRGAEYVKIYPGTRVRPEDIAGLPNRSDLDFGGYARLIGRQLETSEVTAGDTAVLTLFWEPIAPFPADDFSVYAGLRDAHGNLVSKADAVPGGGLMPVNSWEPGMILRDAHAIRIPTGTPPGNYTLEIGFFSPELGQTLEIREENGQRGNHVSLAQIRVEKPGQSSADDTDLGIEYVLDAPVQLKAEGPQLLGYDWEAPAQAEAGEGAPLTLIWRAGKQPPDETELLLELTADGERWRRSRGHSLGGAYPPEQWEPGELVRDTWTALLPVDAPAGRYRLDVIARTPEGQASLATLGMVDLQTRLREFSMPEPAFPQEAVLGDTARMIGYDFADEATPCSSGLCLSPGAPLEVTLYWQALDDVEQSYVRFLHLLDADGRIVAQSDEAPGGYPTTGWMPGEYIVDRATLDTTGLARGNYQLVIGLYDSTTGQRLTTRDGQGHITLSRPLEVQ